MQTIWDWLALALFAGLVVIFLQRSVGPRPAHERVVHYLPPALGCALANYAGNEGQPVIAALLLAAALGYIWFVLRPFRSGSI